MSDDRLSAWLDGELSATERADVDDELARSASLRAERDELAAVRGLVRSLPLVEPPFGFLERLGRPVNGSSRATAHATRRRAAGVVVVAAAAWLLILGFGAGVDVLRVVPPLDALADRHATAYAAGGGFTEMPMDEAKALGPAMADMALVAAWHDTEFVQLVYADAVGTISVFRRLGSLDSARMPADATAVEVGGMPAWSTEMHELEVVVVDAGDAVYTVVGDMANTDHVMTVAGTVAPVHRSRSVWDRTRRGIDRIADLVGL